MCYRCREIFRDSAQLNIHFNNNNNMCTSENGYTHIQCYLLKCGRYYPVPEQPNQHEGPNLDENSTNTITVTPQQANDNSSLPRPKSPTSYMVFFSSLPSNNMITTEATEAILTQL